MKIGILTFHDSDNYGAVLQAFALQEFLRSCGHEVEIIDYRSSYRRERFSAFPVKQIVRRQFRKASQSSKISVYSAVQENPRKQKNLYWFIDRLKKLTTRALLSIARRRIFKNFVSNKLNLSRKRFSDGIELAQQRYDAIVFGSDQIWNPETTGGDFVFWGDFSTPQNTLKIAYAASAGAASETVARTPAFMNALKNFDAISVREQNLANALMQNVEREIKVALDPTLLVDKSVWDNLAVPPKVKRKYVIVYQALSTPAADRIARELAEQIDANVVSIRAIYWDKRKGDLLGETPEQFVGWIKNAACVVTTSFHGTAFSIIYEKPIYYVAMGIPAENRPLHLLRELGLSNRIIGEDAHPKFSEIDYSNSNARLETLRSASREFLETALTSSSSRHDL